MDPKSSQNRSKIVPKSVQNRSKIGPESSQNRLRSRLRFRTPFWSDFGPILAPTWGHLGGQVAAMLGKKSIFGGSGEHQTTNMIFNTLRGPLGTDFGTIFGPKIDPKSVQKRSQERASKKAKIFKKPLVFQCFLGFGGVGNRSKIDQNRILNEDAKAAPKKVPKSGQHGSKMGPSWGQVGLQTRPRAKRKRHRKQDRKKQPQDKPV